MYVSNIWAQIWPEYKVCSVCSCFLFHVFSAFAAHFKMYQIGKYCMFSPSEFSPAAQCWFTDQSDPACIGNSLYSTLFHHFFLTSWLSSPLFAFTESIQVFLISISLREELNFALFPSVVLLSEFCFCLLTIGLWNSGSALNFSKHAQFTENVAISGFYQAC